MGDRLLAGTTAEDSWCYGAKARATERLVQIVFSSLGDGCDDGDGGWVTGVRQAKADPRIACQRDTPRVAPRFPTPNYTTPCTRSQL